MAKKKIITPSVPRGATLQDQVNAMIEALEVREGKRGDALDSFVTYRDLVDKEVFAKKRTNVTNPETDTVNGINVSDPDVTPPTPSGLSAAGAIENVILEWSSVKDTFEYFAFTEVYRNTSDNLANAQLVGTTRSPVYADNVPGYSTYYYWIRHVNTNNRAGQFNATAGTSATTHKAGTGDLQDSAVDTVKIADAAIVDAKVANLSATKITAGSLKSTGWSTSSGVKFDLEANSGNGAMWFGGSSDPNLYWDGSKIQISNKGTDNELTISGEKLTVGDTADGDYCEITAGDIDFFRYINGDHRLAKSLKRSEMGIVSSNTIKQLSGYWKNPPDIMVSPATLDVYDHNYTEQSQTIDCRAINITEVSTGVYEFEAVAELILQAGSTGTYSVGYSNTIYEYSSGWTHVDTTNNYSLPSNSQSVDVSGSLGATAYWADDSKSKLEFYTDVDGYVGEVVAQNNDKNFSSRLSVSLDATSIYAEWHIYSDIDSSGDSVNELSAAWDNYVVNTSDDTLLAEGSLNYIAIGE